MDGTFVVSARYPDCVTRIVPHVPLVLIGANIGAKAMRNARNRWSSSRAVDAPQLHHVTATRSSAPCGRFSYGWAIPARPMCRAAGTSSEGGSQG